MPGNTSTGLPLLNGEPLVSLTAAGLLLPAHRGPGRVGGPTVFRWITRGVRAVDGRVVRLEAVRVGSRWLTSTAAIQRFSAALSAPATTPMPPAPTRPSRPSSAGRELDALGI
jgi:hypothetical protein